MASELGSGVNPRIRAQLSGVPGARELPARGPGGARRKGGVSSLQALVGNKRSCRLGTVGQSKWVLFGPPGREREGTKRQKPQGAVYREAR